MIISYDLGIGLKEYAKREKMNAFPVLDTCPKMSVSRTRQPSSEWVLLSKWHFRRDGSENSYLSFEVLKLWNQHFYSTRFSHPLLSTYHSNYFRSYSSISCR